MARPLAAAALPAAALTALLAAGPALAARGTIEDDYPRALAEAKRLRVPLLVDVWAPW